MKDDPTPIPSYAEDVYAVLVDAIPPDEPGMEESEVHRALDEECFSRAAAVDAIEVLEKRGYIYRVDAEIRITD